VSADTAAAADCRRPQPRAFSRTEPQQAAGNERALLARPRPPFPRSRRAVVATRPGPARPLISPSSRGPHARCDPSTPLPRPPRARAGPARRPVGVSDGALILIRDYSDASRLCLIDALRAVNGAFRSRYRPLTCDSSCNNLYSPKYMVDNKN